MRITFRKLVAQRCTTWTAVRGKRTVVPGTTMALGRGDLPHDLVQFVVEASVGLDHGFWGCVADGATFRSLGRKRTRPGRAVIARWRHEIEAAEAIVADHHNRWRADRPTPAAALFDELSPLWAQLPDGGEIEVEWPSGRIVGST